MQIGDSLTGITDSLSCLHAIEHFGLGRYGDPIDYDGHVKGLANMTRMIAPGGRFYLSAPMGETRVEFNAHRVFSPGYLLGLVEHEFDLVRFSYEDDDFGFHDDVPLDEANMEDAFGCVFGCGIYELVKKSGQPSR